MDFVTYTCTNHIFGLVLLMSRSSRIVTYTLMHFCPCIRVYIICVYTHAHTRVYFWGMRSSVNLRRDPTSSMLMICAFTFFTWPVVTYTVPILALLSFDTFLLISLPQNSSNISHVVWAAEWEFRLPYKCRRMLVVEAVRLAVLEIA